MEKKLINQRPNVLILSYCELNLLYNNLNNVCGLVLEIMLKSFGD